MPLAQTVLGLVFEKPQKFCQDLFFLIFNCLKASVFSAKGIVNNFLLSFLAFLNSLFAGIVEPGHHRLFVSGNTRFWNIFVYNLN